MDRESAIEFALSLARALHRYGTPAHRLEEAVGACCRRLGLDVEVLSTPTALILSFGAPTELNTRMMRVDSGVLDLGKLAKVDELVEKVASRKVSPRDGVARLEVLLREPPEHGQLATAASFACTPGALAVFFGGGRADVAMAAAIGLLLWLLSLVVQRSTSQARVFELVGAAFASLLAGLAASVWQLSASVVTVSAMLVLLPGMSLTVAVTELATHQLISGTARLLSAVIVLLELVVGVAIGTKVSVALVGINPAPPEAMPSWAQWAALLVASAGFATMVQAQARAFGWILSACLACYLGSLVGSEWLGDHMGVLVGALSLGVLANGYARLLSRPAQVVSIPAVMLLVPGGMGLRGMTTLVSDNTALGAGALVSMLVVATAIAAGLLLANAMVSPRRSL